MKDILNGAVKSHYDNKDYTEVVRDAILCLTTEVRKKSDLVDLDGVDLINKAFSEKKPLIKINKLETDTEKNKHRGINDLSKGLIEYFRNPMSHSKQEYSKKVADAILVLLDEVILEEIIGSKSINSMGDLYQEITNELFPNTERYARNLVATIPKNKYYELSIMLYRSRDNITKLKDKIINELVINLSKNEYKEYCDAIERDLFGNIKEDNIISLLRFISTNIWNNFSDLVKVKLEDMILEDINNFEYNYFQDSYGNLEKIEQKNGYLLENSKHIIDKFSNKVDIANAILDHMVNDIHNDFLHDYLIGNYFEFVIKNLPNFRSDIIDLLYDRLKYKNKPIWFQKLKLIIKGLPQDNGWYIAFAKAFNLDLNEEDLFFEIGDVKISCADLPF